MTRDALFVGWDVGAWHCTKRRSQDALVVLSQDGVIGRPWWGNLKHQFDWESHSTFREQIARLCECPAIKSDHLEVVLAIDATLGFSENFLNLVNIDPQFPTGKLPKVGDKFRQNHYLFRKTERWLAKEGLKPLSAINDQIGSQATKALHVLRHYGFTTTRPGEWDQSHERIIAIETYPRACESSTKARELMKYFEKGLLTREIAPKSPIQKKDEIDALWCAIIAKIFHYRKEDLVPPRGDEEISTREGWIWVPKDCAAKEMSGDINAR